MVQLILELCVMVDLDASLSRIKKQNDQLHANPAGTPRFHSGSTWRRVGELRRWFSKNPASPIGRHVWGVPPPGRSGIDGT
jgi:hypothetical protein